MTGSVAPIRRELLVAADLETAFEVFTGRIGEWWPIADLSVHGAGSTIAFSGGELLERSASGEVALWGTVTAWQPPRLLAFSWHPGGPPERASEVEVSFAPAGEQTLVVLLHRGWERFDDPVAARSEYERGWPMVLDRYRDATGGGLEGETWVALLHSRGPAAAPETSVLDDPRFSAHVEFLARMRDCGYLVAAGPLSDREGDGMTILRIRGAGRLDFAQRLATEEDASVTAGLLSVAVRPWRVMLEGENRS